MKENASILLCYHRLERLGQDLENRMARTRILFFDRGDHFRITVPGVTDSYPGSNIDIATVLRIPDFCILRLHDKDGRSRRNAARYSGVTTLQQIYIQHACQNLNLVVA